MSAMAKAGYGGSEINPGLLLVEKVYNYCQKHHSGRTKVKTNHNCKVTCPVCKFW